MSGRRAWLSFERRGGTPPPDDEALTLADDGSFGARRTLGGPRIGSFAGLLPAAAMRSLRRAVEAAAEATDATLPTPRGGATEVLRIGGSTLQLGSNETPPRPWRAVLERVRTLFEEEVVATARAALELVADTRSARLVHAGEAPLDVDLGSVLVKVIRVADEGMALGRWNGRPPGSLVDNGERLVPTPRWVRAGPGWSAPLPFDHPLELAPGDMFQVWVDVPIREEGERGARAGRLYVPVLQADA